ncbi:hypothetical protein FOZ61_009936 [Perkinsus olseni]|uniref:trehalose-phosphatase n=1 Tax=Perkinsus olseni TaxID=32597 RepID=A0A7J6KXV5_PEROL|nr:hypothetical protein FOZ61_009936 [Perkinsus olseni]
MPLHVTATLEDIRGCGPLRSIFFNGFSFLSGNVSSTAVTLNGPIKDTSILMRLFADRLCMVSLVYNKHPYFAKAMMEGFIPQMNDIKSSQKRSSQKRSSESSNIRDSSGIRTCIMGGWDHASPDENTPSKRLSPRSVRFHLSDEEFNIGAAVDYWPTTAARRAPITLVSGLGVAIDDKVVNRLTSASSVDGIFAIGARFAPCKHFQVSLRSDFALSSPLLGFRRILLTGCSQGDNRSVGIIMAASPDTGLQVVGGGTEKVPSTILEKFGISVECDYRIDVLQKEVSLCVNGVYNLSQGVDALKERLNKKKLYIFLDYDGTLTPIVSNPGDAKLSPQMAEVLERLSLTHRVSIVTGRSMDTILTFLQSTGDARKRIHFAASHGFDIWGPRDTHYQVGGAYLPQLHKARDELIEGSKKYPHCVVEDNEFSISVHYRNVHPDLHVDVSNLVHGVIAKYPQLRLHYGKMVYEIKLNLSWNKGKAVLWLLNAWDVINNNSIEDDDNDAAAAVDEDDEVGYDDMIDDEDGHGRGGGIVPIYIGDDITDEDGFRAIKASFPTTSMGILVHNTTHDIGRPTAATYTLEDTQEVMEFLEVLCSIEEDPIPAISEEESQSTSPSVIDGDNQQQQQ